MTSVTMLLSGVTSGYPVKNSLRFRSSASAYLNRTPASASNRTTWTWSGWVKLGTLGTARWLFDAWQDANNFTAIYLDNTVSDAISVQNVTAATSTILKKSTPVFRDPSAWYHIVVNCNTTLASPAVNVYVNNQAITAWNTNTMTIAQNANTFINSTNAHNIGRYGGAANYFDGYLAEVNFIDGQALTPSSFGTYDTNGVWQPIKYSGTYGTNGFYLNFGNTTSTTTLGYDTSGNSNNWTTNNISLTAGSTYDSMTDSPTVSSATVANYAVICPLFPSSGTTISNGNLDRSAGSAYGSIGTLGVTTGKWYWEATIGSSNGANNLIGIAAISSGITPQQWYGTAYGWAYFGNTGNKFNNGSGSAYGATFTSGDVIGVALDLNNGTLTFYKNNTSQGTAFTGLNTGATYAPSFDSNIVSTVTVTANFGQRPFTYTPPTGFNALNTYNLPTPTIANGAQYMAATLYTGTGATQTISDGTNTAIGTTFQPDLVWIKSRSAATNNNLFDVLRGTTAYLISNSTATEATNANTLTAFGSTGFTVGSDASAIGVNVNAATYVGWQWKANGTGVTNTNGSITSTVSANTTAGFSVVTYTGTGANATVGHGLGVAPSMVITKSRAVASNWPSYHSSLGAGNVIFLNATNASVASATIWNNTSPTSSVFSVGADPNFPAGTMVAYCWAAVPGYSAFGSYTGNGSTDGPFVYTGFRPRFVLFKRTDAVNTWLIYDTSRSPYNADVAALYPNSFAAETTDDPIDYLSNGFKMRGTGNLANTSGGTYIYAAFAESPFNTARAR